MNDIEQSQVHGVAVAVGVDPDGPLAGVLILGPPGAGKSLLALTIVETCPWRRSRLVADDVVMLTPSNGRLIARAPAPLVGLHEVRGLGPVKAKAEPAVAILAVIDLAMAPERVPAKRVYGDAKGGQAPLFAFAAPGRVDAPHRVRRLLRSILDGQT